MNLTDKKNGIHFLILNTIVLITSSIKSGVSVVTKSYVTADFIPTEKDMDKKNQIQESVGFQSIVVRNKFDYILFCEFDNDTITRRAVIYLLVI